MKNGGLGLKLSVIVGLSVMQGFAQEAGVEMMNGQANSNAQGALASGSWKMTFGGSVSSTSYADSDTTSDMTMLSGSIGYFLIQGVETGLSMQLTSTTQDDIDVSATQFDAYLKYYFIMESDVVPYVSANLGVMALSIPDGQGDTTTEGSMSVGANVGFEYMLSEEASLFVDMGVNADSEDTSTTTVSYGLSFYF